MISLGTTRARTHTARLISRSAAEGKGDPGVKHQSTSVCRGSELGSLLFFHLLPTARRERLKLRWAGMASLQCPLGFAYLYSTMEQLML